MIASINPIVKPSSDLQSIKCVSPGAACKDRTRIHCLQNNCSTVELMRQVWERQDSNLQLLIHSQTLTLSCQPVRQVSGKEYCFAIKLRSHKTYYTTPSTIRQVERESNSHLAILETAAFPVKLSTWYRCSQESNLKGSYSRQPGKQQQRLRTGLAPVSTSISASLNTIGEKGIEPSTQV